MRSHRPSFTSMAVAGVRAIYAQLPEPLGTKGDPVAVGILPLPYLIPSHVAQGIRAFPNAGRTLHRAYGKISAGLTYHVALRTRAIDEALRDSLATGAKQIVLLGAGLDGRAYRLPELEGLRFFEVDHPNTQQDKRDRLAKSTIRSFADISFVPVDFEKDRLEESLLQAGFNREIPSFWIWEGVAVYLTHEATTMTLRAIAHLSAAGSRVAMTYTRPPSTSADPSRPFVYRGMRALVHVGSAVLGQIGESVRSYIDSDMLAELIAQTGFILHSDENAVDWTQRYWPGESPGPFEWERLAVLERAPH